MRYAFGDYTLDPEHYELRQAGRLVQVEPRVFDLLAYLVQHPGHTVTTAELLEHLYPNQSVPVDRLTNAVTQARKALADTGQAQRYIQTVRRRGYRFIALVEELQQPETDARRPPAAETPMPAVQHGLDQAATGAPLALVLPEPPSVLPPAPVPASAPRIAGHERPDAERRQLTVLMCRLMGAPERSEPLDPEELLEVGSDYQVLCAEVVHRFAGHIAPSQDGQLRVYFGYPQAHEDDSRRAVYTGLEIVQGMAELNRRRQRAGDRRLAVQVGIHTGMVVVGMMGQDEREPLALGDTLSIAAQVQDLAAPDTVLISQATWRLVEGYFICQPFDSYLLEETAEPLVVSQVLQERPAQSRFEVAITKGLTPLVGREHEIGLLRARWAQAVEGQGQVVVVSGEAGIGKSRLVQVFTEHLRGEAHTHIECHGSSYYQQSAFYPIVEHVQRLLQLRPDETPVEKLRKLEDALRPYDFALAEVVPLFAALLSLPPPAHYPPLTLTPQGQKQKTLEVLLAGLIKEAERQPVLLVMEDLHWVDPSTLEFLSLLIDQISAARVLMLLIFRSGFHPPWAVHSQLTHFVLDRLSPRQTETMIGQVVGGKPLPAEVMQQVVATTDGVPLFVEELTKMVIESGLVKEREERYELAGPLPPLAIPTTLHDSLMARLDRLGPAKQVAQLGAVVGRTFAYELLQAVAPVEEAMLQHALAQLVAAGLLSQRGLPPQAQYRFKHALIQEVAYQSLLRGTRRQYHKQIAQVLTERFPQTVETHPELLAHHYTEAGLTTEAIVYWQQAGRQAIARSANLEAIEHLTHGLTLLSTLPATPERTHRELTLYITLGTPLMATKGYAAPEVEHVYTRAHTLCQQVGTTPQLFPALWGVYAFYLVRGELPQARELSDQLLRLAQSGHEAALLLLAHRELGVTLFHLGELAPAGAHLKQGLALYDPQQHHALTFLYGSDPRVHCLFYTARVLGLLGYPDQARESIHEALRLAQELAHPFTLAFTLYSAAAFHRDRGEGLAAQQWAEAAITLASEQGFPYWVARGTIMRGWALAQQGQAEEGLGQIRQGLPACQALGAALFRPVFLAVLGEVLGRVGQVDEGLITLDGALATAQNTGERSHEAELWRLKGELLQQAGNYQQSSEVCFLQALDVARRQKARWWELRAALSLSRLWQRQGQRAKGRQLLAEIYGWFTEGFDTADLQEAEALLNELP